MPRFSYRGFDASGQPEDGSVEAASEKLAFEILRARGLTIADLSVTGAAAASPLGRTSAARLVKSSSIAAAEEAKLASLLSVLFRARLPIDRVIRIVISTVGQRDIQRHFERVDQRVAEGQSFAEAFAESNRGFSPMFVAFIRLSDRVDMLAKLFAALATFLRQENKLRQQVLSALIYPAILFAAALALMLVMILLLTPNLMPVFQSAGREPPATLAILSSLNEILRRQGPLILLVGLVAMLVLSLSFRLPPVRRSAQSLGSVIPVLGGLARTRVLIRLTHALHLALVAKLPLSEALRLAGTSAGGGDRLARLFWSAADQIDRGGRAGEAFQADPHLPAIFQELFQVGEATNSLETILPAVAQTLEASLEQTSQRLLAGLTPVLTLIIGGGVGWLIYTIMGAILEINALAF